MTGPSATAVAEGPVPFLRDVREQGGGADARYGERAAADGLARTVRPGAVTGFPVTERAGGPRRRGLSGPDRPAAGDVRIDGRHHDRLKDPVTSAGAPPEAGV